MPKRSAIPEPVFARDQEAPTIRLLERVLEPETAEAKLVASSGEEIAIPESVYQAFRQIIHLMASGQAAYVVPLHRELTTQEAADILNVSRPFLVKLLEQGEIPFIMVGSHRRIRFKDLIDYKRGRDARRREALSELTQFSQDEGYYDEEADAQ